MTNNKIPERQEGAAATGTWLYEYLTIVGNLDTVPDM